MDNATIQFVIRALCLTVCFTLLAIVGIDAGVIFHFGDGEAIQLIGQLNGPFVSLSGAIGTATILHPLLTNILNRLFPPAVSVANPGTSSTVTTSTVTTTAAAPVPAPSMNGGSGV